MNTKIIASTSKVLIVFSISTLISIANAQPTGEKINSNDHNSYKISEIVSLPNFPPPRNFDFPKSFAQIPPLDKSRLLSVPNPNFDKSELLGDWRAEKTFTAKHVSGLTRIEGIVFTLSSDSSLTKEWTNEGVMHESSTPDGVRRFPSSFDYKTLSNLVLLRITFSANDLKVGTVIPFEILGIDKNQAGTRILRLKNDNSIIELTEVSNKSNKNFVGDSKTESGLDSNNSNVAPTRTSTVNIAATNTIEQRSDNVDKNNQPSLEDRIKQRRMELESSLKWDGKARTKEELLKQSRVTDQNSSKSCGTNIPRLSANNLAIQEITTDDLKSKILNSHQSYLQKSIDQPRAVFQFNELKKEVESARTFYNTNISKHCAIGARMIDGLNKAANETALLINLMNNFVGDLNKR